jgi:ABC-2 type transport system ATP-binding protein
VGAVAAAIGLSAPAVELDGLHHRYGARVALDSVSVAVARGELFALLGPNGSGKSTLFRILSTLLRPDGGTARVLGHDVVREPDAVRRQLGVVFQHPSLDALLTVEENVLHHGRLYGLAGRALTTRVEDVLARFALTERRRERVGRLSGGLARRVELAKVLVVGASLLLLDEPSTGLDPLARREFLAHLQSLRDAQGVTVVLTTHHLEEAERCDRIALLDRGRLVALGSPDALKAEIGGDVLMVQAAAPEVLQTALRTRFGLEATLVDGMLRLEVANGHELVPRLVETFPDQVRGITYGKPTLEDVFVHLTGRRFTAGDAN